MIYEKKKKKRSGSGLYCGLYGLKLVFCMKYKKETSQSASARKTSVTFTLPYRSTASRINRNCIYFTAVTEQLIQLLNRVPSSHSNICLFL